MPRREKIKQEKLSFNLILVNNAGAYSIRTFRYGFLHLANSSSAREIQSLASGKSPSLLGLKLDESRLCLSCKTNNIQAIGN